MADTPKATRKRPARQEDPSFVEFAGRIQPGEMIDMEQLAMRIRVQTVAAAHKFVDRLGVTKYATSGAMSGKSRMWVWTTDIVDALRAKPVRKGDHDGR